MFTNLMFLILSMIKTMLVIVLAQQIESYHTKLLLYILLFIYLIIISYYTYKQDQHYKNCLKV